MGEAAARRFHPEYNTVQDDGHILESDDGVSFRFKLQTLAKHSPFFADIADLPTPQGEDDARVIPLLGISSEGLKHTLDLVVWEELAADPEWRDLHEAEYPLLPIDSSLHLVDDCITLATLYDLRLGFDQIIRNSHNLFKDIALFELTVQAIDRALRDQGGDTTWVIVPLIDKHGGLTIASVCDIHRWSIVQLSRHARPVYDAIVGFFRRCDQLLQEMNLFNSTHNAPVIGCRDCKTRTVCRACFLADQLWYDKNLHLELEAADDFCHLSYYTIKCPTCRAWVTPILMYVWITQTWYDYPATHEDCISYYYPDADLWDY